MNEHGTEITTDTNGTGIGIIEIETGIIEDGTGTIMREITIAPMITIGIGTKYKIIELKEFGIAELFFMDKEAIVSHSC